MQCSNMWGERFEIRQTLKEIHPFHLIDKTKIIRRIRRNRRSQNLFNAPKDKQIENLFK
jgi:hypothetical protein